MRDHVKIPREGQLDKPTEPSGKRLLLPGDIERGKTQAKYQKTREIKDYVPYAEHRLCICSAYEKKHFEKIENHTIFY